VVEFIAKNERDFGRWKLKLPVTDTIEKCAAYVLFLDEWKSGSALFSFLKEFVSRLGGPTSSELIRFLSCCLCGTEVTWSSKFNDRTLSELGLTGLVFMMPSAKNDGCSNITFSVSC
jgi:hypothetical protein